MLAVVGILALWGALDEAHQEWIPGRRMDAGDLVADLGGALAGAVSAGAVSRRSRSDRRG